jgi:hypothetical protein
MMRLVALSTVVVTFSAAGSKVDAQAPSLAECQSDALPVPTETPDASSALAVVPEARVIYFVPADLAPDSAQEARILQVSKDVHRWYWDHTDNERTIPWNTQTVERVIGTQSSAFYNLDPWPRVLAELGQKGFPVWSAQKLFMVWVKGGGRYAGGALGPQWSGVAMLGADNFVEMGCVPTHASNWPCTPGGAMAHELGHALGMPHPDTAGGWGGTDLNIRSVMGSHWNFPERSPRNYNVPSPWGLLNYERDHLRYNPAVSAGASPFPSIPGDRMELPALPSPALRLDVSRITAFDVELRWNANGAFNYEAYASSMPSFQSYTSVPGSPTTLTTLVSTSTGSPIVFFKVFEIPLQ